MGTNGPSSGPLRPGFLMQDTAAVFGAEQATLDLVCGLRDAGLDPHFLLIRETRTGAGSGAVQAAVEQMGFPFTVLPVDRRFSPALARSIKAVCRTHSVQVLHVIGYKANLHAWMSGVRPVVATVHGWLFRRDWRERLYDTLDCGLLKRCDRVICLSRFYEEWLLRAGIARKRLVRIPSGLRELPPEYAPMEAEADRPLTFGMMGRFSEEKNHAMFLAAAGLVGRSLPDARFLIAGKGPLEPVLRQQAAACGVGDRVRFSGYMEVAEFFREADVYVLCSRIENLPYSVMQAMAWSRPVVATRTGGTPDLVEDGVTGVLVGLDDETALAEALCGFAGPEGARRRLAMGQAGRRRLAAEFSATDCAARHVSLYRTLAGGAS